MIGLAGHPDQFQLDEMAYTGLSDYLDRAALRLRDDPDGAEILGDLERSVGDRLSALLGSEDRVVTGTEMGRILEAIGVVDADQPVPREGIPGPGRRRRLVRIRQDQEVAGVCTGIAAYAEVDVDWVRTVVILGTLVTGGILGLVYIALVLILPVEPQRAT